MVRSRSLPGLLVTLCVQNVLDWNLYTGPFGVSDSALPDPPPRQAMSVEVAFVALCCFSHLFRLTGSGPGFTRDRVSTVELSYFKERSRSLR